MATYHEPEAASVVGFPVPLMNPTLVTQTIPYPEFESKKEIPGYTFAFSLMFLPYDRSWILTLKREYQSYLLTSSEYEQEYFVFRTSLMVDGSNVFSMGAGYSLESASDASCHSLVRQIKRIKGIFIMPRNIIGYPNLRGQCYLISAFLPLLFCPPFISCLFNSMFEFKRLCHLGVHKENLKLRREPEDPFYWTSSLFKIYKDFYQVSNKGRLQLLNIQYFSKYRLHDKEYEKMQNVPETYQLPTDDLRLDRSLIKGLCSVLSTYCSQRYATPGGDERSSYVHIIRKIASENPIFIEKFFTKLSFKFTCSGCTGGPFKGNLQLPLLAASPIIDLESLLNNGHTLCHEQHLQYPHTTNELNCMEPARCILEGEIISLPEVLCFGIKNEESEKFKPIPEFITHSADGIKRKFFHLVSSVVITCYKSKKGIDYQDFYHPYEEGDIDMGAHTFLHFRAIPDYVEVNNGFIYKVDDRIFRKPTPCSFHMYLDEKYMSYVPQVDMNSLSKNPFYPV